MWKREQGEALQETCFLRNKIFTRKCFKNKKAQTNRNLATSKNDTQDSYTT